MFQKGLCKKSKGALQKVTGGDNSSFTGDEIGSKAEPSRKNADQFSFVKRQKQALSAGIRGTAF